MSLRQVKDTVPDAEYQKKPHNMKKRQGGWSLGGQTVDNVPVHPV
jgi:hypothetical protein